MIHRWLPFLTLLLFAMILLFLQDYPPVAEKLKNMQVRHVPSELISYNKLGELFQEIGVTTVVPNHSSRYKQQSDLQETENIGPFQKRRQISGTLIGIGEDPPLMRSAADNLSTGDHHGNTTISVVTEPENITGEQGILTNYRQRGRKSERLAYVAIQKGNAILHHSAAGLRLHGGTSRDPSLPKHSYRLYFRKIYGKQWLETAEIFPELEVLRTLVVHDDTPKEWPLNNVIANELYAMTGVDTAEYSQAEFILNGISQGLFWLSPHLSKKYIRQKYNIQSLHYQRYKGKGKNAFFREDISQLEMDNTAPYTFEKLNEVVDAEGLMNYFIAVTFSGNTDWNQGVAYKDAEDGSSKWKWICWDLDHSFIDYYAFRSKEPEREIWRQRGLALIFETALHNIHSERLRLFRRLFIEDPSFEEFFIRRYVNILNHDLSPRALDSLYQKYNTLLENYGRNCNPQLLLFFQKRHEYIRKELRHFFKLGEFQELHIEGDFMPKIIVDGYSEILPYSGYYPAGTNVIVELPQQHEYKKGHWLVDGTKIYDKKVTISLQKSTALSWVEQ